MTVQTHINSTCFHSTVGVKGILTDSDTTEALELLGKGFNCQS